MQIQCHIVLYLPDYHVNTHRVCSTLRNIDWHYTTSICLPVQADQYFKLDEAGQAIVQNH